MACLAQLLDPEDYRRCDWDLRSDAEGRAYWHSVFRWHLDEVVVPLIREEYPEATPTQLADLRSDYLAAFEALDAHPERRASLDILDFTTLRGNVLGRHGFEDPFRGVKARENETAIALLPGVLKEIDSASPEERRELLLLGLMAGNIFDLGSVATAKLYRDGNAAFRETRSSQPARPWHCDDVDAWWERWSGGTLYRHVVWFVDNAGSDIVLGNLPLVRWMLAAGARVTLAANSQPALNDITAVELEPLLRRCTAEDAALAESLESGRLRAIATGSTAPLLDMTQLDDGFVDATADADLIMLHGMGRAIESNFHARLRCDAVWMAVLKDEQVASRIAGKLYDCVFRFCAGEVA